MEPEKIKDLFLRSLSSDIDGNEREVLERELFTDHRFSEGFGEKLMKKITSAKVLINGKHDLARSFDSIFMRVAIPAAAAVVILVISILLSQGSLSYDTLLGIDNEVDGVLISLLAE
ncbi:MAG TPA: hypothetical protein ENH59_02565 [Bacteroidetes bacterium]|nr:hypothetical protein [Bacteroidota bacterium]